MYPRPERSVPHDISVNINLETQALARPACAFEIFCAGTYFLRFVGVMTNKAFKPGNIGFATRVCRVTQGWCSQTSISYGWVGVGETW